MTALADVRDAHGKSVKPARRLLTVAQVGGGWVPVTCGAISAAISSRSSGPTTPQPGS